MVSARRRRGRATRGLTLIEVMIALLVTTIALLGALATVGVTVRGAHFSRNATEASVLVQAELESMVSYLATSVTAGSPADGTTTSEPCLDANGVASPTSCTAFSNAAYPYDRETVWSTATMSDGSKPRTVTVTVNWHDLSGNPHSITATRFKVPQ